MGQSKLRAAFSREMQELIKEAEANGWTFRATASGHMMGRSPDGVGSITIGKGHSPNRAVQNARSVYRRWALGRLEA